MNMKRVLVFNQTKESFLSLGAEVVDGLWDQVRGLAGRGRLRPGGGLWISGGRLSHTLGALGSVDLVCLDGANCVVDVTERFPPFRVRVLGEECASVLELPSRTVQESHTELGDQLKIAPGDELQQVEVMYSNGGSPHSHRLRDLNARGGFVVTDDRWYPGTIVEMYLRYNQRYLALAKKHLNGASKAAVRVRARVVSGADQGVRVEFVYLKKEERRAVRRFLSRV